MTFGHYRRARASISEEKRTTTTSSTHLTRPFTLPATPPKHRSTSAFPVNHSIAPAITSFNMVSLSLDGSSMSRQQISEALTKVKNEGAATEASGNASCTTTEFTDKLTLLQVDLDADQIELFVDAIRSRMLQTHASNNKIPPWEGIHISNCIGLVNDAILSCTTATNIKQLSLRQSTVNAQTIQCLTYGLKYNQQLQSLHLAIPLDAANSRNLSTAVARSATLQELSLENCTNFEEPGVVMNLSFGLRLNQHLKSLILDSCYLQDDQVHSILMSLEGHNSLKKLSLQRNSCHTQGMAAIATLLHGDLLEELDLSFLVRKTKEERQQEEAKQREEAGEEENAEEEKQEEGTDDAKSDDVHKEEDSKPAATGNDEDKVDDNNGDDEPDDSDDEEGPKQIQVRNTNLRVFLFAGNGIGDAFLESILNIFGKYSNLRTLSLFGNRLSSQGILRLILKAKLPHLKQLKRLYLGHNTFFQPLDIKDDLIHAMKTNYSLEEVMIKNLNPDAETTALQELIDHYCGMNVYGRQIMACFDTKDGGTKKAVPLGLWPEVLARANRLPEKELAKQEDENKSEAPSFSVDTIFCLLHGPVLYENPNLGSSAVFADEGCCVGEGVQNEQDEQEGCVIA